MELFHKTFARYRTDALYVGLLLIAAGIVFYTNLDSYSLHNWDEGNYAHIARFMLQEGNWLIPYSYYPGYGSVVYRPFLEKPPLLLWLQAISIAILGASETAIRLPAATASLLTTTVVYVFGRMLANRRTGLFAGMVYLTIPFVYLGNNSGRFGTTDALLVFFGSLFVLFMWRFVRAETPIVRRRSLYLAALTAAFAFLSKGVAAGIYLVVLAPFIVIHWRVVVYDWWPISKSLFTALIVAFTWPAFAYAARTDVFERFFIEEQVLQRLAGETGPASDGTFTFMQYPYFRELLTSTDPWGILFLPAIFYVVYRGVRGVIASRLDSDAQVTSTDGGQLKAHDHDWLFIAWWAVAVYVFFMFTGNLAWYLLPMYVPLALVVGRLLADASIWRMGALAAFAAGVLLVGAFSYRFLWNSLLSARFARINAINSSALGGLRFTLAFAGLVIGVLTARPLAKFTKRHLSLAVQRITLERGCYAIGAFIVVIALVRTPTGLTDSEYNTAQDHLGTAADDATPASTTIYLSENATAETPFYSFAFYAGRRVDDATSAELASDTDIQYAVITESELSDINRSANVLARGANRPRTDIVLVEFSP